MKGATTHDQPHPITIDIDTYRDSSEESAAIPIPVRRLPSQKNAQLCCRGQLWKLLSHNDFSEAIFLVHSTPNLKALYANRNTDTIQDLLRDNDFCTKVIREAL
jgi:hypothetical protein